MLHGSSPVSDPIVVACKDKNFLIEAMLNDLDKYFEKAPVIIILPDEMKEQVINHMKISK